MAKYSIIVPVYNGSKYLERCIDSIKKQTFSDYEVIIVDDGSTDRSGNMADEYAASDSRFISLHKENGGLGSARNFGLGYVSSEYVGFLDCDDWINPDTYEYLYKVANEHDADISAGKFAIVHSEEDFKNSEKEEITVYEGIDKLRIYLEIGIKARSSQYSVCTKLYKSCLFDDVRFPVAQLYEDVVTNYKLIESANKFVLSNKYVYNYFLEGTSITRNKCSIKDLDLIKVGRQIEELTRGTEIEELGKTMCARTYFSLLVKSQFYGFDQSIKNPSNYTDEWLDEVKKNYKILINSKMPFTRKFALFGYKHCPVIMGLIFGVAQRNRDE